jgi:hypothetical protein
MELLEVVVMLMILMIVKKYMSGQDRANLTQRTTGYPIVEMI